MDGLLAQLTAPWASLFANSAAIRTAVGFAHVGGLVVGAGRAIVTDRAVLGAAGAEETRAAALAGLVASHRTVMASLAVVIASGLMLWAADVETYLVSWAFYTKMTGLALLLVNGRVMLQATRAASRGAAGAWSTLRVTAILSLLLWTFTTLMGAALPNV